MHSVHLVEAIYRPLCAGLDFESGADAARQFFSRLEGCALRYCSGLLPRVASATRVWSSLSQVGLPCFPTARIFCIVFLVFSCRWPGAFSVHLRIVTNVPFGVASGGKQDLAKDSQSDSCSRWRATRRIQFLGSRRQRRHTAGAKESASKLAAAKSQLGRLGRLLRQQRAEWRGVYC